MAFISDPFVMFEVLVDLPLPWSLCTLGTWDDAQRKPVMLWPIFHPTFLHVTAVRGTSGTPLTGGKGSITQWVHAECHCFDILVMYWNRLNFFELF